MSEKRSYKKSTKLKPDEIIAIQDIVLEYILSNRWRDYQRFARCLSETILRRRPGTEEALIQCIQKLRHSFYSFNGVSREEFLKRFPMEQVLRRLSDIPERQRVLEKVVIVTPSKPRSTRVTFRRIFPAIESVSVEEAKHMIGKLDMPERSIQDALRKALRERGATNITERKSDTALEIADLEDFSLEVGRQWYSFASVVKGYSSLKRNRVRWEDVSHQITKAYQGTNPDHVILVLAKDPVDGLITQLVNYGESVGNRNLIILVDPVDLARFLHSRQLI